MARGPGLGVGDQRSRGLMKQWRRESKELWGILEAEQVRLRGTNRGPHQAWYRVGEETPGGRGVRVGRSCLYMLDPRKV